MEPVLESFVNALHARGHHGPSKKLWEAQHETNVTTMMVCWGSGGGQCGFPRRPLAQLVGCEEGPP